MLQDQDQFYDVAHRNRVNAFVVGSLDIGERTTITAGGSALDAIEDLTDPITAFGEACTTAGVAV